MSNHRRLRLLPEWLVSYRGDWLQADIVAGLTTGAVIIPKAMAYAMMAGLPVQVGLCTSLVPMVIYAVLGASRVLSVSTTTTLAILTAAQLGQVVPNGDPAALLRASATLTLLVGAALVLACLLRLLAPLVAMLPQSALAAMVIVYIATRQGRSVKECRSLYQASCVHADEREICRGQLLPLRCSLWRCED
jgi:MFS superfamily sulfate permease-like transporter